MKISRYNVTQEVGDDVWLFNSLSGAFLHLSREDWTTITAGVNALPDAVTQTLSDNGVIVDDDVDETMLYRYLCLRKAFSNNDAFIYIAPTMRCNFVCRYCFEAGNKNAGIMTEEIQNKLIQFLKTQHQDNINIIWFGGEPLLGFSRILSICKALNEAEIKFSSSMITNGSLLSDEKIAKLDALNLQFIQISLDGVGEMHNKRRYFKGGKPSFDIIMANLTNLLHNTEIKVVIQVTIDNDNKAAFDDVVSYCRHYFLEHIEAGRLEIGSNDVKDRNGFDDKHTCFTNAELIQQEIMKLQSTDNTALRLPGLPGLSFPCMYKSSWTMALDSEGYIYKCIDMLGDKSRSVGSLQNESMSKYKLAHAALHDDVFQDEECVNCNVLPICGGGCPLDRERKRCGKIDSCCSKYKDGLKELLPYIYQRIYKL